MLTWREPLADGRVVEIRATGRAEGDLAIGAPPDDLAQRRSAIVDRPWACVRQVHGDRVVVVEEGDDLPGLAGTDADALVTRRSDLALAVQGADCAVLGLWSPEGVVGVAHAGWRGLEAGVVGSVAEQMRALGAGRVVAVLGPCIGPECYEFGAGELDRMEALLGPSVRSTSSEGTPALDFPAAVIAASRAAGVDLVGPSPTCTACDEPGHWSHRARGDRARQSLVLWIDGAAR